MKTVLMIALLLFGGATLTACDNTIASGNTVASGNATSALDGGAATVDNPGTSATSVLGQSIVGQSVTPQATTTQSISPQSVDVAEAQHAQAVQSELNVLTGEPANEAAPTLTVASVPTSAPSAPIGAQSVTVYRVANKPTQAVQTVTEAHTVSQYTTASGAAR